MSLATRNPKTTIKVISNSTEFLEIERLWNRLVDKSCTSPFLLSGFVKEWINSTSSNGWVPLLLIFSIDGDVAGLVALATKKKFGIRSAKFLQVFTHQPDFIVLDQHREIFIEHTLGFLFRDLNCKFVDFSLHANSPNLRVLERYCKNERINFSLAPEMGHNILPISLGWTEFKSLRGRNFRKRFNKMKRNFDRAGSWKIVCKEGDKHLDSIKRILDVEKLSWKEKWRIQRGEKIDLNLQLVLEGARHTAKIVPGFKWKVWFLELNEQTLAYYLVFQYKEMAFFLKSSFDERYKKLHPGSFLRFAIIREFFNTKKVQTIDFITDLPHHRKWTSICLTRVRAMLTNGTLPTIWKKTFDCPHLSKVMSLANRGLTMFEKLGRRLAKSVR